MTAAIIYLGILVVLFFLLVVVPQRRRMAAHRSLVDAVGIGDEIVSTSGIHGTVHGIADSTLEVEIAPDVVITLARGAVAQRRRPAGAEGDVPRLDETAGEPASDD
ncbi:MAG TPA: preprotein translocase subunit YajC [Acidimicrobiia bacterium]|nr:preprotein translocase subunit YajC [Acidimicrobiia bacterium]